MIRGEAEMGVQEHADLPHFWPLGRWLEEEKATKEICILERVQFLLGQEYKKREFSGETGECRELIYNERGIPAGTREKKVVGGWVVNGGSDVQCSELMRLDQVTYLLFGIPGFGD